MPKMIGLHLTSEHSQDDSISDVSSPMDGSQLRYAFMALLAINLFFISGVASFVILYFFH